MLPTLNVIARRRDKKPLSPPSLDDTAMLRRLVHTIVRDFNGDTTAYFDSIRPDRTAEDKKAEETESRIAHRFAKSL